MSFHNKLECLSLGSLSGLVSCLWVWPGTYPFTWVGFGLTCKHKTRLEKLARDRHSSLLQKSVNCGQKKFKSLVPACASEPGCEPEPRGTLRRGTGCPWVREPREKEKNSSPCIKPLAWPVALLLQACLDQLIFILKTLFTYVTKRAYL
jgi:hypothetical protein